MTEGTFLAANHDLERARAVVQGLPWDGSVSWRAGASEGPRAVRAASQSIESYSPMLKADLEDVALGDVGDVQLGGLDARAATEAIATATETLLRGGLFVVSLGGDHSVSIGTARGARRVHPELACLVYDAHLDLRDSYDGSDLSHACGTRRMAEGGPTVALGIRSGSREEFAEADTLLAGWSDAAELPPEWRAGLRGRPLLVSVDLDVLDPATLPGTGNPEPGGISYLELRSSLLGLAGLDVVAVDLVEVSPNLDPSGLSAVVAAELAREVLLGLGPREGPEKFSGVPGP